MKRTLITPDLSAIPQRFHTLIRDANVYDSHCASGADVYFVDKYDGLFLKSAPKGSLVTEYTLASFFANKGLAPEILDFFSTDVKDWMLTKKAQGEDATHQMYLDDPKRLCDTVATTLRYLHSLDISDCPVQSHTARYISTATRNYLTGNYDSTLFPDNWGYASAEEAWRVVEQNKYRLKDEVLLHGDYCLPNIILNNWRFSAFIDLGNGGVGDRHVDLFWGVWTLFFNLGTDKYSSRFLDVYGRDAVDPDMLKVIAAFEVFG
ncbi:MAG: aminoglycoside 3'-phosphotransferase [Clostridia bacterium]|nr:aminoglycoside 3'-phosphotransferase [Clostridia bacterium]